MHVEGNERNARTMRDARRGIEERGQAEAIARNLEEMSTLRVPIVVTITGEGGSGGALAVAVGDRAADAVVRAVVSRERSP